MEVETGLIAGSALVVGVASALGIRRRAAAQDVFTDTAEEGELLENCDSNSLSATKQGSRSAPVESLTDRIFRLLLALSVSVFVVALLLHIITFVISRSVSSGSLEEGSVSRAAPISSTNGTSEGAGQSGDVTDDSRSSIKPGTAFVGEFGSDSVTPLLLSLPVVCPSRASDRSQQGKTAMMSTADVLGAYGSIPSPFLSAGCANGSLAQRTVTERLFAQGLALLYEFNYAEVILYFIS
jgi:hypothetical protein